VDLADREEIVWRAAERMHHRAVGALLVLDENRRPIGILTDRDIVERVVSVTRDPMTTRVEEVMTTPVVAVRQSASINSALDVMKQKGIRRLAVVDDDGVLVGFVTLDDILMLLAEEMTAIGKLIAKQTPMALAEEPT
jgi:CBS domain-containing protein